MSFDAIIIGAGVMGASTAWQLSQQGHKVLLLEQGSIPNPTGSSFGDSRLFRMAYYEHPGYVPMLHQARDLWRQLESESGQTLFNQCGGLYIGAPSGELISKSIESAENCGLHHISLSADEIMREYPQFQVPEGFTGFFDGGAGFLYATRCVSTLIEQSLALGAAIRGFEKVTSWVADGDGVTVSSTVGTYSAARLIITAGPWTKDFLQISGVALHTTRQSVAYVWPEEASIFTPDQFPVYAIEAEDNSFYYGAPRNEIQPGIKVARHDLGPVVDPETADRRPNSEDEKSIRPALASYIPKADGPLLGLTNCLYTNSTDSHFILDFVPDQPQIIFGTGFSGHGFKFGPVIGSALAAAAVTGAFPEETSFLSLARF